eukprot:TRINITY_DN73655_c0_g1_i1.p1 TRINITY_DN73655_c0_g1~~TRINITY_DN73655_c0_g1_i1.p1  ORF type:complete len:238 (-),score=19.76 TRINITY_DN73655_c0_g1_i1:164-877(-)
MPLPHELQVYAENIFCHFPDVFLALGKCMDGPSYVQTSIVDRKDCRFIKILIPQQPSTWCTATFEPGTFHAQDGLEKSADNLLRQHSHVGSCTAKNDKCRMDLSTRECCGVEPLPAKRSPKPSSALSGSRFTTGESGDPSVSHAQEMHLTFEPWRGIEGSGLGASMASMFEPHSSNHGTLAQESIEPQSYPPSAVKDNTRCDSRPGLAQRRGIGTIADCVPFTYTEFGTSPDIVFLG